MQKPYLRGLNTLRFFAAFFVIISHGQISVQKMGFDYLSNTPFFTRGEDAVEFFFTLSGFLITFLLQKELAQTATVSVKAFYLRRVFRIWPLYFMIVGAGFIFLGIIYPRISGQPFFDFPLWKGLLLFVFFLPNWATSFYITGMLHPLWSIGVEEQYYLIWAPLVKLFKQHIIKLVLFFMLLTYGWYTLLSVNFWSFSPGVLKFLLTQKFYAMATGGFFGIILHSYPAQYRRSVFAGKPAQFIILAVIIYYYLIGYPYIGGVLKHFVLAVLYGLLIINTCILEKPLLSFENQLLNYLGIISYGLYMFHMLVDYTLRYIAGYIHLSTLPFPLLMLVYQLALLGGTILVASLSFKYIESYFLRLKEKYA